jgi:hypothetical protein
MHTLRSFVCVEEEKESNPINWIGDWGKYTTVSYFQMENPDIRTLTWSASKEF